MASDDQTLLTHRQHLRERAAKTRRHRRNLSLFLVAIPVLLALLYGVFLCAPRYAAETRFSVRSGASAAGDAGGPGSLLATSGIGAAGGFVDGWAVSDFIASRDCMRLLDRKIGLRQYLSYQGRDPLHQLPVNASEDQLYQAYSSSIDASFSVMEQINVLKVRSFSSKDSETMASALIDIAQDLVNRMDDKGVAAAMDVSRRALAMAEKQDADARDTLTKWRVDNGNIDPGADAAMLQNLASLLEGELNTAEINLDKIRTLDSDEHPMLAPARAQVAVLKKRLATTRQRLSGAGDTDASQLRTYEALKSAVDFANQNLATARQNYQQAFTDTLRLRRYLSVIVQPIAEVHPSAPNLWVLLAEALACGLLFALLGRLVLSFRSAS